MGPSALFCVKNFVKMGCNLAKEVILYLFVRHTLQKNCKEYTIFLTKIKVYDNIFKSQIILREGSLCGEEEY